MKVACVDFGSTFTKVTVVETTTGTLVATASSPTTITSDIFDGLDNARAQLATEHPDIDSAPLLACSSAGGGLRLGVVGYERAITAEAGYRVGLSAGARVVHVTSGELDAGGITALMQSKPDVILLVGGTDGGNSEVLLANAHALADRKIALPVVVAGNQSALAEVVGLLQRSEVATYASANVLPRIGELEPRAAREHIREVFIEHVIGGKHLSKRVDLSDVVRAATPDAVLAGVELLADGWEELSGIGDVVVVDVGGATTDVYSVVTPDAEQLELDKEAVST
ncbi:MAG: glutamate mutase L, partial [Candidatus Nanopelagicales bacterium]